MTAFHNSYVSTWWLDKMCDICQTKTVWAVKKGNAKQSRNNSVIRLMQLVRTSIATGLDDPGNMVHIFSGSLRNPGLTKILVDPVYSNITVKILLKQSGCKKI